MFDNATRSIWLEEQLWPKLRESFKRLNNLPNEALITVGYPSSGARGRSEKIRPAEFNEQWSGNPNEKFAVFVHPVYWDKPANVAKAILFAGYKRVYGARWGAHYSGISKNDDGTLDAIPTVQAKIDAILEEIGEPPQGFGIAFPVREVQRARLRKYVPTLTHCPTSGKRHYPYRIAADDADPACASCGDKYSIA